MLEDALGDHAQRVAGPHAVAGGGPRRELPHLVARQRLRLLAARQEEAVPLGDHVERVLQAVEHLRQQAGAELHGEQLADELDRVADLDAGGALEDLHVGVAAAHADDLGDQTQVAEQHVGHLVLADGGVELHGDQVAVDAHDAAGAGAERCPRVTPLGGAPRATAHSVAPSSARSAKPAAMRRPSAPSIAAHFSARRSLSA